MTDLKRYRLPEGNVNPHSTEPLDELRIIDVRGFDTIGFATVEIALHESVTDIDLGKEPLIHGFIGPVQASTAQEAINAILAPGQVVKKNGFDDIIVDLSGAEER